MSKFRKLIAPLVIKARQTLWKFFNKKNLRTLTFTRHKTTWTVSPQDAFIGFGLFVYGDWQFGEIDSVLNWLKNKRTLTTKNTIINAGANIGSSSIHIAKNCPCQVLAIEPIPDNFELLRKNVLQNNLSERIHCFQGAVYEQASNLTMVSPHINPGGSEVYSTLNSGCCDYSEFGTKTVSATGLPLFEIIKEAKIDPKTIAFVWSDTQGSEGHVIRSGQELWRAGVPLVIEFWPRGLQYQGEKEFLQLLHSYFKAYCIIPTYKNHSQKLIEEPIETLEANILENQAARDDLDLLLLPRTEL
jgi:FkbM family methyltransferase